MFLKVGRSMLIAGAVAQLSMVVPIASPAHAQRWEDRRSDWNRGQRDRDHRVHSDRDRRDWDRNRRDRERSRSEWERKRRNDAKTNGIVAGVVGTAVVAGIIAAATSGKKKDSRERDRAEYCRDRYGNYDRASDGYRASDGRIYRCE